MKQKNHNGSPRKAHTEKNIKHLSSEVSGYYVTQEDPVRKKGEMKTSPKRASFQGVQRELLWYPVRSDISSRGRDEGVELGHEDDCCADSVC